MMADAKIKKIVGNVTKLNFVLHISQICHFNLENCFQFLKFYLYIRF